MFGSAPTTDKERIIENYKRAVQKHEAKLEEYKRKLQLYEESSKRFQKSEHDVATLHSCGEVTAFVMTQVDSPDSAVVALTEKQRMFQYSISNATSTAVNAEEATNISIENEYNKRISDLESSMESAQMDTYVIKMPHGSRYLVNRRQAVPPSLLLPGTRVSISMHTHTIMNVLPPKSDPTVSKMSTENPGDTTFNDIGGLGKEVQLIREVIELPLTNPEIFKRIGIAPPKGALLFGPPGTGKTLIAKALANTVNAKFLKIVASSIIGRYTGDSARVIREMFQFARLNAPCVIFLDEIDAIAGKRMSGGTNTDREVSRALMQLLKELDGFTQLEGVKVIMATNRPDILDPALMRPGRIDRKVEIKLPTEAGRYEILKIHSRNLSLADSIDFTPIVKLADGFNGADLRNICTEAGLYALRAKSDVITQEFFLKAVRELRKGKAIETPAHTYETQGAN